MKNKARFRKCKYKSKQPLFFFSQQSKSLQGSSSNRHYTYKLTFLSKNFSKTPYIGLKLSNQCRNAVIHEMINYYFLPHPMVNTGKCDQKDKTSKTLSHKKNSFKRTIHNHSKLYGKKKRSTKYPTIQPNSYAFPNKMKNKIKTTE